MPSRNQTVYLVTGANRGIGFGVVKALSERSNVLIFATARDPKKAGALNDLAAEKGNIKVIQLDVTNEGSATAAASIVEEQGDRVDVVIANAGIGDESTFGPVIGHALDTYRQYFEVNTLGPVVIANTFVPLLNKSENPKFVLISSAGGSFGLSMAVPMTPYLISKAAANFFALKMHQELTNIAIVALSPGMVQTDMGAVGARYFGMQKLPLTADDSAAAILKIADTATRDSHGGKFWDYTGEVLPW
ncbi:hypothetical protein JCM11251_001860 [Rhodosporidiobolus azoricus]